MYEFKAGSASKTIYVKLVDSSSFLGKTGLVHTDITPRYVQAGAAAAAITPATLASASAAWSSGGFKEVDATNAPGLYRFDVPDAAIASGPYVVLTFKASLVKDEAVLVKLPAYDPYDGVRLGLTALPNAAAAGANGLAVVGTQIPNATAGAAGGLFIAGANAATSVNITGNITGNLSGSVGSVTGAVGSVTGAVGSVTGAVGSVTGSVGSVLGAVGGNVNGSVASVVAVVSANLTKINGVTMTGDGSTTPFGP